MIINRSTIVQTFISLCSCVRNLGAGCTAGSGERAAGSKERRVKAGEEQASGGCKRKERKQGGITADLEEKESRGDSEGWYREQGKGMTADLEEKESRGEIAADLEEKESSREGTTEESEGKWRTIMHGRREYRLNKQNSYEKRKQVE
ncbi:hypothetical protein Pmani_038128 [Petrolisthes manimaculis]|uniref:Uncharacterized protein n=1 Tax=Petrolisthes manimaculis TaxID=1843537 RepID=A0AAE1TKU3_9EUCA|nr:hypothetical protein Pmani_038128 [Petrolisthes manimaculis]